MSNLLVALSGANFIHDAAGLMESDLTVAYEKLIVDNEILGMCQRVLRGVEVNDETLAADLIIRKGPGQDYLAEEHTVRHMRREFFVPRLANREKRPSAKPGSDAIARAKRILQHAREAEAPNQLSPQVLKQVLARFPDIKKRPISVIGD